MNAEDRLNVAIIKADDEFFARIAEEFPEVKSGDVTPEWVATREQQNREMVSSWIVGNAPRPTPGKKYRTKDRVSRFPFFELQPGEVGVAQAYEDTDDIWIQMERYLGDGLEPEWRNCIIYHGIEVIDFFHDFEEVPGQEDNPPEPQAYEEGDLIIFDDGIACPVRGEVIGTGEANPAHYVVSTPRSLNRVMADRDPTFMNEEFELDLTRADVKPANHMTNEEFDAMVREYWRSS